VLEQTHGKVQQLVLDPEGEFATLREKFDYVLASKQGGDTAADPRAAKLLAERLLELRTSAILDIYELKAHERVRFVRLFLEALVDAPKKLWHPVLVVVDEAHVYCPQKGEAESAGAVIDLCTRGRKRGFCAVLATQRLSKLHKDAAAELNNKLIGRTGLDVDRKRASEELGFSEKEQSYSLRQLNPGEFFGFGPALSIEVQKVKIGSVQTTHPKAGARLAFTPPPPTAKIKRLLPKLADLPAEAEKVTRTVEDLKRDLVDARRQLTLLQHGRGTVTKEKVIEKRVEVSVVRDAQTARIERMLERGRKLWKPLAEQLASLETTLRGVARQSLRSVNTPPAVRAIATSEKRQLLTPRQARAHAEVIASAQDGRPGRAERAMLTVLAQYPEGCNVGKLALLAGYRAGGGFRNRISTCRTNGWLIGENTGIMRITEAGREVLGEIEPLPAPGLDLLTYWLNNRRFGKAERAALQALADHREGLTGPDLAEAAGYAWGGGFRNRISTLRTAGVITGRNNDVLQLAEDLR
jgi:hypothetical protein